MLHPSTKYRLLLIHSFLFGIFSCYSQSSSSADVWYDFTNSLADSSTNGYTLTASGATLTTDRFATSNSAYSFDGINDYLYVNSVTQLPNTSETRRVSLWFMTTDTSTASDVLIHWGAAASNQSFGIALGTSWGGSGGVGNGYYGFNIFGWGSDILRFGNVPNIRDSWQFLELDYYQDTVKLYLNSTKLLTRYKIWNTASSTNLNIGRASWGDYYSGSIDEIRIFGHKTPLPVELISFTGKCINKKNIIKWTTASETNNNFFTIERSTNAVNWEEIGVIKGAGNSTHNIEYEYTDDFPNNILCYYRLKQTDFDGKFEYSNIIHITACEENWNDFTIHPNPSSGTLNLNYNGDLNQVESIEVYDGLGKVIYSTNSFESTINLLSKISGTYFVRFKTPQKTFTERVVVNR